MQKSIIIFEFICTIYILGCFNLALASPEAQVIRNLSSMPLTFTENRGQWDERVLFRADAGRATMWFMQDGACYQFTRRIEKSRSEKSLDYKNYDPIFHKPDSLETIMIKASFVGANPDPAICGEDMLGYKCNYFIGNNPEKWQTNVPNYKAIVFQDIYPGIDLKYYGNNKQMEYDFIVSPGADPSQICIRYEGADSVSVNENGELVIDTDWGSVVECKPLVYQIRGGKSVPTDCAYSLIDENRLGFELVNGYDPEYALIIDPVLSYSTYLGGSDEEISESITIDDSDNIYITGETYSTDFPTEGGYQSNQPGWDVFIAKFNSLGSNFIYCTYLGGDGGDWGSSIFIDDSGNAYIGGYTNSSDFPTEGPYQTAQGNMDAFVTKLNSEGNGLVFSTYLGGSGSDHGTGISLDNTNHAYIVGFTESSDYPTKNEYQSDQSGRDVFITKLGIEGDTLVYSTYLGGGGIDNGTAIAVDDFGNAYITGSTFSTDFPTEEAYQTYPGGSDCDAFVTKLYSSGDSLVYSSYLGGANDVDEGHAITVDTYGNAYITGRTWSSDFPVEGEYQIYQGNESSDAFVTKFNSDGSDLVYSTFLGGFDADRGIGISIDAEGNAYVTGTTNSSDFPTEAEFQTYQGDYDAFVTKFNSAGNALVFSTYLGGDDEDTGHSIAVDISGNAYITGFTSSTDFPTENEYQTDQGDRDVFVTKIYLGPTVDSLFPSQNTLNIPANTDITVMFDTDMNPATINDTTFVVHASQTGLHSGIISYDAPSRTATFDPDGDFAVGEIVTATLSGYIESDFGVPMGASYTWQFTVAVSGGSGEFVTASTHGVSGKPFSLFTADLNADGAMDIITADSGADSVSVFLNSGDGNFSGYISYPTGIFPHSVYAADFDADGDLDLATANKIGKSISVLKNDGFGFFEHDSDYVVDSSSTSVIAADLNGDGYPDLATTNIEFNTISILINLGDGTFDDHYTYETGNAPHKVYAADLDNDADIDLVTANYTISGSVSVFLNQGDGTFSPKSDYSTGTHTSSVTASDLNEDGFLDLAASNWSDKTISILINIGNGTFAPQSVYPIGGYSNVIISGDLDGDYDIDLITAEIYLYGVSVLLNNGYGIFDSYQSYSVGMHPHWIGSADFDGDGDLDLAVANVGSYDITVLLNINNIQVTNTNDSGTGSLRWAIDSANLDPGPNDILFDISGTIALSSELPAIIDDNTRIRGSTAPGKAHSVALDGGSLPLGVVLNSSNNVIEGLEIRNFNAGINFSFASNRNNTITNNVIYDNYTGLVVTGNNQIGGYESVEANLIYNNTHGLNVVGDSVKVIGNHIDSNSIGIQGIVVGDLSFTLIDSNTISHNEKGITLYTDASRNTITRNLIYLNDSLGIDLNDDGVTPNDSGDIDTGPNDLLNFPEIDSVYMNPNSSYTVYGTAAGNARVEFFVAHPGGDTALPADPSGHGEAYEYLGYTDCNLIGDFVYILSASAGQLSLITTTATDTLGNTSEFSENFHVVPGPLIIVGYSYAGSKSGCPSNINLRVIDPNGNSIGYDIANIFYDEIPNADYTETTECNDSVYITNPLTGTYTVEVVGEPDALPSTYYSVGVRLDGTDEVVEVVDQSTPPQDSTDSYVYEVEENWHYINGDANRDSTINIFDITFTISYLYLSGQAPWPVNAADANCDLTVNIFDITYLISFLYLEGDAPCR